MVSLTTQRLLLRPAAISDVTDMHAVLSHADAMRYWSCAPHEEIAQTEAWIGEMIASPPDASADFLIEREGRVIGKIGAHRLPWFGYVLHPDWWGQGFASEALAAYLAHVATRGDVKVLHADIDPRNHASIRLVERHGFRESGRAERTWLTHMGWCDSIYMTLDAEGLANWR